jgi:hypothetical protein
MLCLLAGRLWHQRRHAWTLPGGSSQEPSQGKGPPPQTEGWSYVVRLNGTRQIAHVRSRIAYPLSKGHEPIGSLCLASDIVTVRECVGVAFSFAEKVKQSVFLRWDRVAISRWPVRHYHSASSLPFLARSIESPGSRQVEYVLQIAASAALFSSALNSTGKQITTSRLDPSNHLVEHVAAGHASTVPQTILNALLKHVLGI